MPVAAAIEDFTLSAYRELLAHAHATHEFVTFCEYDALPDGARSVLLRHDIDYSLPDALHMARLEANMGVRATYFLLLGSPFYNLLSPENSAAARELCALGHEVGLHYDVAALLAGGEPLRVLDAQAALLGELSGQPVASIAMHNPSVNGEDVCRSAPYINAYAPQYTGAYHSDSCMAWRDSFITLLGGELPPRLQLLIHPCLWTEQRLPRAQKLDRIYSATQQEAQRAFSQMRHVWAGHSGVAEHDLRQLRKLGGPKKAA